MPSVNASSLVTRFASTHACSSSECPIRVRARPHQLISSPASSAVSTCFSFRRLACLRRCVQMTRSHPWAAPCATCDSSECPLLALALNTAVAARWQHVWSKHELPASGDLACTPSITKPDEGEAQCA
eukprot:6204937-Pleurochrysis_carterae.AAC.1